MIKPGERGFLAAALGPGMRAVTVGVSAVSGVAGFVFPGDRVDIVLTQEVAGGGDGTGAEGLRDDHPQHPRARHRQAHLRAGCRGQGRSQDTSTVTLEATPKIAEKIAVAQTIGQISLSLRSIADNTAELERAIASGEVNVPEGTDPRAERRMLLEIASKPADASPTFTVGSDVSRFQRSSVPSKSAPAPDPVRQMDQVFGSLAKAIVEKPAAAAPTGATASAEVPAGPVVRVARGNSITIVPVGAK
jgi:pilus assembly protein CpaB